MDLGKIGFYGGTGLNWLRMGPSGGPLWTWQETFRFHKGMKHFAGWITINCPRPTMELVYLIVSQPNLITFLFSFILFM